jgi:hypothetical protein
MKPDLYEKDLVGHSRDQRIYLLRPVFKVVRFMTAFHRLKVEKKKAWSRLDYVDRKGI